MELTPLSWKYLELSCTLRVELFSDCSSVQRTHAAVSPMTHANYKQLLTRLLTIMTV